jgi:predicted ATPase
MIEEPESHLHPKLQSLLADFFADAYKTFGIHFIIETHSEYLIRKLQYLIAKKEIKKEDVAIYYFDQDPTKEDYIRKMEIDDNGFMKGDFGEGFFDEASRLISDLWNIQSQN